MNINQCRHLRGHSTISKTTTTEEEEEEEERKTLATYTDCQSVGPRDALQLWVCTKLIKGAQNAN
jgi:hypothetical protein